MDKKSKIFLMIFGLLIFISVAFTYYRIMIKRDYIVEAEADCDPTMENCFIWQCDPEAEECTGDPEEDISYYKILRRNASRMPLCDPANEDCRALSCGQDEQECEFVYCSDENMEALAAECNDPIEYVKNNPVEGNAEAAVCEEDVCVQDAADDSMMELTGDEEIANEGVENEVMEEVVIQEAVINQEVIEPTTLIDQETSTTSLENIQ